MGLRFVDFLFLVLTVLLILDGMVSTPIALKFVPGTMEDNLCANVLYQKFGLSYFFWSEPLEILAIFFLTRGIDQTYETFYLNYYLKLTGRPVTKWERYLPVSSFLISLILLSGYAVVNNFSIIFKWMGY